MVAPTGPVYQAGTLSGNPLAMTAGLVTLKVLAETPDIYSKLEEMSARLEGGFKKIIEKGKFPLTQNRVGSMFTLFFTPIPVVDYVSAKSSNTRLYGRYFNEMLQRGIYLAPSQFEAAFLSATHSKEDIDKTIAAASESLSHAFASQ